ncbi:YdeI/OmpD-associated family protein [Rosistilla oblonga]|uniref:Bacteriocin-protection, YdeI or OmpD-Associated n=1 Tax=Rosistilla oblonga TaxID=2527990 RepID=A0A518J0S6_9BACT|nr:YdeI/OmpD-associated family protein [Rosistilla oblonga]QDV58932.1 hypothetical protein Mal33_49570 [Rosistilla oblonga]
MPEPDPQRIRSFETPAAYGAWLQANHDSEPELWLKLFKKATGIPSIDWTEAVIESLCWGWIDGIKKSLDDKAYLQRVTPRRPRSHWSKRNCEHVERLIAEGRMQEPGLAHVHAAQADGRWEAAYSPASEMVMHDDFLAALRGNPKANQAFEKLSKSSLYLIGFHLQTAKRPETLQKRIVKYVGMLEQGKPIR